MCVCVCSTNKKGGPIPCQHTSNNSLTPAVLCVPFSNPASPSADMTLASCSFDACARAFPMPQGACHRGRWRHSLFRSCSATPCLPAYCTLHELLQGTPMLSLGSPRAQLVLHGAENRAGRCDGAQVLIGTVATAAAAAVLAASNYMQNIEPAASVAAPKTSEVPWTRRRRALPYW